MCTTPNDDDYDDDGDGVGDDDVDGDDDDDYDDDDDECCLQWSSCPIKCQAAFCQKYHLHFQFHCNHCYHHQLAALNSPRTAQENHRFSFLKKS